jgi:hypothetical protein
MYVWYFLNEDGTSTEVCIEGNQTTMRIIDNREIEDTTVSACEGDKCRPTAKCMLSECIAPTPCKLSSACLAREIYANVPKVVSQTT